MSTELSQYNSEVTIASCTIKNIRMQRLIQGLIYIYLIRIIS